MSESTDFPIRVSDADGNLTVESSSDLLARQQAARDLNGAVKYTPPPSEAEAAKERAEG